MWLIYTLARPPDAPYFVGIIGPTDNGNDIEPATAIMQIYGTAQTQEEAEQHRSALNKRYHIVPPPPRPDKRTETVSVQCVTTGVIYANASQAARANHVSRGFLHRHLNRPDKFPAVKGLTFKRICND